MDILTWLQQQGAITFAVFGDIASNKPAPARLVLEEVLYALIVSTLLWIVVRVAAKVAGK